MNNVKCTKNELKRQKDATKRYNQYLPMLQLKKKQLQIELFKIIREINTLSLKEKSLIEESNSWVGVFNEDINLLDYIKVKEIITKPGNVAGIDIQLFEQINFEIINIKNSDLPLWAEKGIQLLQLLVSFKIEIHVLQQQKILISHELQTTSQRVNLFEKIKIPEAKENIRHIRISLGDQQTAAVVTGKIAKAKIIRRARMIA